MEIDGFRLRAAIDATTEHAQTEAPAFLGPEIGFEQAWGIVRADTDQLSLIGRNLYATDLAFRRSAALLAGIENRPISTQAGGLVVRATRPGSLDALVHFYGQIETLAASHPILLLTAVGVVTNAKGLVGKRFTERGKNDVDRYGFPIPTGNLAAMKDFDLPSWVSEGTPPHPPPAASAEGKARERLDSRIDELAPEGAGFAPHAGNENSEEAEAGSGPANRRMPKIDVRLFAQRPGMWLEVSMRYGDSVGSENPLDTGGPEGRR